MAMLKELRCFPLLDGWRGAAPADIDAFCRLIEQASLFAAAFRGRVCELELNPVIVHSRGAGCTPADALLTTAAPEPRPSRGSEK
jgi:acetyltransferase